jgi:pyruvate dehydrogenase E2 component (dihydrolipoamide acetyltransferase)
MAVDIQMPLLGDVMQEGTLVEWLRPDGARVAKGEPIYRLETDKVSLEVEAPATGILQQVVAPGTVVPVNGLLGRILAEGETPPPVPAGAEGAARAAGTVAAGPPAPPPAAPDEIRASPAARRLARELGVDLAAVATTVRGGRIREADVQAFAARAAAPRPAGDGAAPAATRPARPLAGRRRVIAERLHRSLQQMAQLTISQQVDVTECVRLREQLLQLWAADGVRPTYTDFVLRAAALALREHPDLNATLEDDGLVFHEAIDIGLAVDAPEGLIVPVLRGVDRLSLREVARASADAAERARANRLAPDDVQGGTFTVTTLGALGIDFFTPIVNPPQVAILGIGRVFPQLALEEGRMVEHQALYLNLSFDHRALDGAPAARFLNRVKALLELPVGLL